MWRRIIGGMPCLRSEREYLFRMAFSTVSPVASVGQDSEPERNRPELPAGEEPALHEKESGPMHEASGL